MKFIGTVETKSDWLHIELDVENEEIFRAKVGQATTEINRRFGTGAEKTATKRGSVTADAGSSSSSAPPAKPTLATSATAPSPSPEVGKGSNHAK